MLEAWTTLEELLAEKVPRLIAALRPGASEATLARLEATVGQRLPESLRAFLAVHDGQDYLRDRLPEGELIATHTLHCCEQIEKQWLFWYGSEAGDSRHGSHTPPNYPGVPANRFFVEVTASDGDALVVDLGSGAVYFHVRVEGIFGPLASSFEAFIEDLLRRFMDGRAEIEDAGTNDAVVCVEDYDPAHLTKRFPRIHA
jgi:cell wall assembly regulator SMI1